MHIQIFTFLYKYLKSRILVAREFYFYLIFPNRESRGLAVLKRCSLVLGTRERERQAGSFG